MPIYEYRCGACGRQHEIMQKLSEPRLTDCPACGKPELVKLVSAAGFQLKGNGWYATDFRGGKTPAKDGAQGESKTGDESKPKETATADAACGAGACPACT